MTISHSMQSPITRKLTWAAVLLLAAAVAACGGSTQASTGTAPSLVSPLAAATDGSGTFGLFKEGKGKSPDKGHSPDPALGTPTDGTTPDPDEDAGDIGEGHGHGKAAIQLEGFVRGDDIDGTCNELMIVINHVTVTTADTTEFQRATCQAIVDATATGRVHLHIAAKMQEDVLVASYVRMQGPKGDDGDDADEDGAPPTTSTTPTTGTTPK